MVLTAILLSAGMVGVQAAPLEWKYILVALVSLATWVLSGWALSEGLSGIEWLTVLLPPVLFTASVGLFYVLLPEAWWARLLIIVLYGIGQYALLLTANIFSVAAIRTIALFRSASAVGFVLTLLTGFFLFDTILSFRLNFWEVGLWVAIAGFFLLFPGLWAVNLETKIPRKVIGYSVVLALMMGLLSIAISFWPISIAVASLFLCTMLYIFLGVAQHHFSQRLFPRTVWEYVTVGVVVLITMLFTSGWGV